MLGVLSSDLSPDRTPGKFPELFPKKTLRVGVLQNGGNSSNLWSRGFMADWVLPHSVEDLWVLPHSVEDLWPTGCYPTPSGGGVVIVRDPLLLGAPNSGVLSESSLPSPG